MFKKILIILVAVFILINAVSAIDSNNWTSANVGYETFKIPPQYENPYSSDFDMYEFDENIDVFTIRYVNPNLMDLYGHYSDEYHGKKVDVAGHDAVHFTYYDRHDGTNNSILWFSAGEEFYSISWIGHNITPAIKEVVKSVSKSNYTHKEFYSILDDEYNSYVTVRSIESQRFDYPHEFYSYNFRNGLSFGKIY